ncbi:MULTISPECIES: acyl-homoserine-lactone synthase [unclassified Colwellia]|uniref:acyl-homoserine-lactone synthase n=1 Tax=unclassified Colwellia TaxID=196834 RepID=UPI0015F433DF|nr:MULTISPECIES: acyl-homoserine-lactone synthase [unclassified Colwellia]MBA6257667.1 GNAT family N-acetyltransferase [Colwellia sp. MB3u-28]MBA6259424.1 GNAT family N-acetyltransferase [Colwellia sp. MB3u-41]MBA6304373.1 GNAT family N-acetyltransferase [Colwellia sp. MB02u-14]
MTNIHYIEPNNNNYSTINNNLLNDVYRLRYDTFKTRLSWEVNCENGLEKDEFDKLDVTHIAMTDQNEKVVGCWRALPTEGSYMLRNIFPELMRGENIPHEENVWEISRFTVDKAFTNNDKSMVSNSTAQLVKSFYDFAQKKGIKSYVLVTTVACERILRCLGVETRRMGDGKSMQIGIERSVALWVNVNESLNISCA